MKAKILGFCALLLTVTSMTIGRMDSHAATVSAPDDFPNQALTIIIPGRPGGTFHELGSKMADALRKETGIAVDLANKPVAALDYYTSLPPNGYTILLQIDSLASQLAACEIDVDPSRDLIPLAIVQTTFSQIYVRSNDTDLADWNKLAAYVNAHPGKIKIAYYRPRLSGSDEESADLETLLLRMLEKTPAPGLKFDNQPIELSSERYLSLIERRTDALIEQPGDVRDYIDRGLIKPVLTLLMERHQNAAGLPQTPSLAEIPGDFEDLYRFRGFFVQAGVPPERLAYLEDAFRKAYYSPLFQKYNEELYMNLLGDPYRAGKPAREFIQNAVGTYRRLLNMKAEDCHPER